MNGSVNDIMHRVWKLFVERKGKGKEADLYSAYRHYNLTTKRSDVDHTELPANTPHLPFLRISIPQRTTLLLTVSPI